MLGDEELELLDKYLGDLIEKVVTEYEYEIDFDDDYDGLLEMIYNNIKRNWFKGQPPSMEELENKLRYVRRRHPKKLEVLISYLVSKYIGRRGVNSYSRHSMMGL